MAVCDFPEFFSFQISVGEIKMLPHYLLTKYYKKAVFSSLLLT